MNTIVFITGLRGPKKIKVLKALSQINFLSQPVLLCDGQAKSTDREQINHAVNRTVLRIREVYLDHRNVIWAGELPNTDLQLACHRFQVECFAIVDGKLPMDALISRVLNAMRSKSCHQAQCH